MSDHTPAQVMAGISIALQERDMVAAADLIRYLAVIDPSSAQAILDTLELTK